MTINTKEKENYTTCLQVCSHRDAVTMHEQDRREIFTEHIDVGQIFDAFSFILACVTMWRRQCSHEDGSIGSVLAHELVQDEVLRTTWEIIEAEGD